MGRFRQTEAQLFQKHTIAFIREAAKLKYVDAFMQLQFSAGDEQEQYRCCEEMEVWQSVEVLIAQHDKLQKYVRTLIKAEGDEQTATAAREYLNEIGIET